MTITIITNIAIKQKLYFRVPLGDPAVGVTSVTVGVRVLI